MIVGMSVSMISKDWQHIAIDKLPTANVKIGDVSWILKLLKWE